MNERGWTDTEQGLLTLRFGEWLAETQGSSGIPTAYDFQNTDPAIDDDTMRDIITHYQDNGWLDSQGSLGGLKHLSVRLNQSGLAEIRRRQKRRGDKRARSTAARDAVLDWLYSREGGSDPSSVDDMEGDPRASFEGDAFSTSELEAAAAYLKDRGLVEGSSAQQRADPLRPKLTPDGVDCVEQYDGSTVEWLRRGQSQTSGIAQQFNTHFNAPVSGQVGIAGGSLTQTQNQGVDVESLTQLLDDVRDAVNQVEPDEAARVLAYLDTLEAEAITGEPDPAIVTGTLARLKQIASKAGNALLTAAVTALANGGLAALGIG